MPRGGHREKAGRKSGWVNSETQPIRVPKILANRLLEIAKHLDQGDDIHFTNKQIDSEPHDLIEVEPPPDSSVAQLSIFPTPQEDELEPPPQPLGLRALAKRLDVSSGTLSRYKKTTAKSLAWMFEKDEKWGWFYIFRTEKYHPIHPSEFDHLLSKLNNEENYENF